MNVPAEPPPERVIADVTIFARAIKATKGAGGKVALTLSDPFCIERHRDVVVAVEVEHDMPEDVELAADVLDVGVNGPLVLTAPDMLRGQREPPACVHHHPGAAVVVPALHVCPLEARDLQRGCDLQCVCHQPQSSAC